MRKIGFVICILLLIVTLSGCSTRPESQDSNPSDPSGEPASAGREGQNGAQGADGSPAPGPRPGFVRKEIASQDFKLSSLQPGTPILIQIPEGTARLLMGLDYQTGAYQDAGFTLGGCHNVSPVRGTAVSTQGTQVNVGGSTSLGILYDCGELASGQQNISWTLQGTLEGHVTVYADLPA